MKDQNHNFISLSHIDSPEGREFCFEKNEVHFSTLKKLFFEESNCFKNHFFSSQLDDLKLNTSHLIENRFINCTLQSLMFFKKSGLKKSRIKGSCINYLSMNEESEINDSNFESSQLWQWSLGKASHLEKCQMGWSSLKDCQWSQVQLHSVLLEEVFLQGSHWSDVEMNHCRFKNCRFEGTIMKNVKLSDINVHHIDFSDLTINSGEEFMEAIL